MLEKVFPSFITFRGDKLVLIQRDLNDFGSGAVVHLDADGDGVFEHQVTTDADGLYTISLEAPKTGSGAPGGSLSMFTRCADGTQESPVVTINTRQLSPANPANSRPANLIAPELVLPEGIPLAEFPPIKEFPPIDGLPPEKLLPLEPEICGCTTCSPNETFMADSLDGYAHSYTPAKQGVELANGKLRQSFPITSFETRRLGFDFHLHHTSLVDYGGPWGQGVSHSFNMMIVQTGALAGEIITPDLRCYPIHSEDGATWFLPVGFFSTLTLDTDRNRWTLAHFSGLETSFYQGARGCPGYPVSLCDPNGNVTRLEYDASGLLQRLVTDLGQVQTLTYNAEGLLQTFTDHLGRQWRYAYDAQGRLTQILTPETEFANLSAGQAVIESELADVLVTQARVWTLSYADAANPSHITALTDPRGAVPQAFAYDDQGRVVMVRINGKDVRYEYNPQAEPPPLAKLEATNRITRLIDREGNITDYEFHTAFGGPLAGLGRYGLRRTVTFTERGKGNAPLRDDEPDYWEQRWLHDCHCLSPQVAGQPFSSDDAAAIEFDDNGIPTNWPRDIYTYNQNRQVTRHEYTDGVNSIATKSTYQPLAYGEAGQYSRLLSQTDPRAFDDKPLYAGLNFTETFAYDGAGNLLRRQAPMVTRGVNAPQTITEFWSYNRFGQPLTHTDPNGNLTVNTYYDGLSSGGDINTKGEFGGYLKSVTRGADGSADAVTNLTTTYKVNALGMITQEIDPKGFEYDTKYNDLKETTREIEPAVTLRNGLRVRYETCRVYDGAGNLVLERRSNSNVNGLTFKPWIDRSMSYDAVNNLLTERVEVDANDANDLITRYAYDGNDDLIVTQKPEGNRTFRLYDERRLLFKTFAGVAPGFVLTPIDPLPGPPQPIDNPFVPTPLPLPTDKRRFLFQNFTKIPLIPTTTLGYPTDKRAVTLARTTFINLTLNTYDARANLIQTRDGRGNLETRFFDFHNRQIAYADPNGNGWGRTFDDASNVLTQTRGAVSPTTGQIARLLERSYARFDEVGRQYQQVLDIDLTSAESRQVNPDEGQNSSYLTAFDPGGRVMMTFDGNGNPTSNSYDAADRLLTTTDALSSVIANSYDANANLIRVQETEVPGAGGAPETYVTTYAYDELNRCTQQHIRGLSGNSLDHAWFFAYDSRHNQRLVQDTENNFTLTIVDDNDRLTRQQRFGGDPFGGSPAELLRYEWAYDRNSRVTEERAFADVSDLNSVQVTCHAYDNLDRRIRTVYPDSDDPISGSGNGPDNVFDRVETAYDENSNLIRVTDQRGVVFDNTFDPGNRLTEQVITLPAGVPGPTQQTFSYDPLNRLTSASNNYAKVNHAYDPFSRLTEETQSLRLDGSGFDRGWDQPIQVTHSYDKQSNRTAYQVLDGNQIDLDISTSFDALNRVGVIAAQYFNTPRHNIARYTYVGPRRVQTKTLGNGAALTCAYDPKRRLQTHQWNGPSRMLAGFEYGYDRMDNALFERFTHDMGLCDHFYYNDRYEVTGVSYRVPGPIRPLAPSNTFDYDDVFNRRRASFGSPFDRTAPTTDRYTSNRANEYTQLTRNGAATSPTHDRAGNATRFLVRPVTANPAQPDVPATARWDAFDLLFDIDPGGANPPQDYRYDPLRRRIVTLALSGSNIQTGSRRYIYDGWSVVEERLFDEGATLEAAPSTLERIYVNGMGIDEPLLTAIDRDQDGALGGDNGKNVPDPTADQEYYFLNNRLGSVMALLDADNPNRMLEYYRYTIYGEPTILPVVDDDGDGLADTPLDLTDNFSQNPQRASAVFGNPYLFTARRFDEQTGLYYNRNRYYEPRGGRFVNRDPVEYVDEMNMYHYVYNRPGAFLDPFGTTPEEVKAASDKLESLCTKKCLKHCKCTEEKCKNEAKKIATAYVKTFHAEKRPNHPLEGQDDIHMGWRCYRWAAFIEKALRELKLKCWTINWVGFATKQQRSKQKIKWQLKHNYVFASLGNPKGKSKPIHDCGKVLDPWREKSPKVFDIVWGVHKWNYLYYPQERRGYLCTGEKWKRKTPKPPHKKD